MCHREASLDKDTLSKRLHQVLPQTQCQACGHKDCLSYAQALANEKDIPDKCIPGGMDVLKALCTLLDKDPHPYSALVKARNTTTQTLSIEPSTCIGCHKCIPACPTDAIVGAKDYLHQILPEYCTGCSLCIKACPVDCIIPTKNTPSISAETSLERYEAKSQRAPSTPKPPSFKNTPAETAKKQRYIAKLLNSS